MEILDVSNIIDHCSENISVRQACLIRNEKQLLDILEKRDLIDRAQLVKQTTLTTLKVKEAIARYAPKNGTLQNLYALERQLHEERVKLSLAKAEVNLYDTNQNHNLQSSESGQTSVRPQNSNCNIPAGSLFEERKAWIYKQISVEIGRNWRAFGRGINIREGEMDDLEANCKGIEERVYKMLAILEKNEFNNVERIYYMIIKSLEESCSRRKLSDKIKRSMIR